MASTKIINVLKDDKFEEILDLFRDTPAKEVIFVLPKKSKCFKNEEHFMIMGNEAEKEGKAISILCSNPEINEWARKYKFDVLLKQDEKNGNRPRITTVNQLDSVTDEDEANPDIYEYEDKLLKGDHSEDEEDEGLKRFHVEETEPTVEKPENSENEEDELIESPIKIKKYKKDLSTEGVSEEDTASENAEEKEDLDEDEEEDEVFEEATEEKIEDGGIAEGALASDSLEDSGFEIRTAAIKKNLDIISPEKAKNLKISQKKQASANIEVKSNIHPEDAKEMWEKGSIWSDLPEQTDRKEKSWGSLFRNKKPEVKIYRGQKSQKGAKRLLISLGVFAVVLLGFIIFLTVGSAKITIIPKSQPVNFQIKVSASDKFSSVDSAFNKIPGQLFDVEKTVSKTADATGQKDIAQKAKGTITVHNELSVAQPLVATTRFETQEGLIFRTLNTVSVPAGKTINVNVIADKAGSQYNVPAGKFIVATFKESNDLTKLSKVYGVSSDSMHGGTSGKAKVVTDADFNNLKDSLTQQLKQEISDGLKSQSMGLKIINSSNPSIKDPVSTAQPDDAADSFTITLSGSLKTIGFKESDLDDLIKKYSEKNNNLTVIPEKLTINFSNITYDNASDLLGFTVLVSGTGYAQIDGQKIIQDLMGKNDADIKTYLQNAPGVASAKVILSPLWVKKMPKNEAKITWTINYQ